MRRGQGARAKRRRNRRSKRGVAAARSNARGKGRGGGTFHDHAGDRAVIAAREPIAGVHPSASVSAVACVARPLARASVAVVLAPVAALARCTSLVRPYSRPTKRSLLGVRALRPTKRCLRVLLGRSSGRGSLSCPLSVPSVSARALCVLPSLAVLTFLPYDLTTPSRANPLI